MNLSRRQALGTFTGLGLGLGTQHSFAQKEPPQKDIPEKPSSHIKLSLAAYSFRQWLELSQKPAPKWTYEQFIEYAARMPLDAVELTAYYFAETTPEYLATLKAKCTRLGLDISGTAIGNDFCTADAAKLANELKKTKDWIEHTSRLGGKTIRIFAGNLPKGDDLEKTQARCVEKIQEACDHAKKYGIILALENHGGITATADQLLTLVKAAKHPNLGVNLDTGNFRTADPYADMEKVAPYAVIAQVKTDVAPEKKPAEKADLKRIIGILKKANYRGYVALEYEGKEPALEVVPGHIEELVKLAKSNTSH